MIYSRKYGRSFKNRPELMRCEWRDRQTKPIFSWGGWRDANYSDEWRREHGLKTRQERRQGWRKAAAFVSIMAGAVWLLALLGYCSRP